MAIIRREERLGPSFCCLLPLPTMLLLLPVCLAAIRAVHCSTQCRAGFATFASINMEGRDRDRERERGARGGRADERRQGANSRGAWQARILSGSTHSSDAACHDDREPASDRGCVSVCLCARVCVVSRQKADRKGRTGRLIESQSLSQPLA